LFNGIFFMRKGCFGRRTSTLPMTDLCNLHIFF
jgi:hypothetical protein